MKKRLSSRLTKKRNKWLAIIWEQEKAGLTMLELGKMFELSTQQIYSILKEAREAKEKDFYKHLKEKREGGE